MPNYKGGSSEVPEQQTHPGSASEGYLTSKDGIIYPKQVSGTVNSYLDGEGSMGFERNQGAARAALSVEKVFDYATRDLKMEGLKEGSLGSHAI